MLKIILCEDDSDYRELLRQKISTILFDKEEVQFECFADGRELINKLECGEEIIADFIFLDIKMPILNGMSTARILYRNRVDANLVFVTSSSKHVFQGYEVHAYDYILKPVLEERLEAVFHRYFWEMEKCKKRYFTINHRTRNERIPLKYIRYFMSDKRKIKIVLDEPYEIKEFYRKISDVEEELREVGFMRCHQSYLVNAQKIWDLKGRDLILMGNEHIPVSKKYLDKLKGLFRDLEEDI